MRRKKASAFGVRRMSGANRTLLLGVASQMLRRERRLTRQVLQPGILYWPRGVALSTGLGASVPRHESLGVWGQLLTAADSDLMCKKVKEVAELRDTIRDPGAEGFWQVVRLGHTAHDLEGVLGEISQVI